MAHHQQLLDWIENELINRNLHLGDDLPDDRVLAREVGISQNHMRESLKHCEEIGVLKLYEGRKKSIIAQLVREPATSAGPAVSLYLASSRAPRQDLLATCLLLEHHALAGPSYDQAAFEELDRIVAAMQDAGTSLSDFHDLEADFHIQLGRLSGNVLISALLATLRDAMIEARFELVSQVPLWSATASRLRMEYRAIVDAARSGDAALAQTLLKTNLQERFAEAGHRVDMTSPSRTVSGVNFEPVEVETQELVPEEWGGPIDPELFEALASIQPMETASPAGGSAVAPPTGSATRRRRGTVGPLVRATSSGLRPEGKGATSEAAALPQPHDLAQAHDLDQPQPPAEGTIAGSAEAAALEPEEDQPAKKRFDVAAYFGFRKGPSTSAAISPDLAPCPPQQARGPERAEEEDPATLGKGHE